MYQALPAPMLTGLMTLAERLVDWARSHRQASLAQYEETVLTGMRVLLPDLLRTRWRSV